MTIRGGCGRPSSPRVPRPSLGRPGQRFPPEAEPGQRRWTMVLSTEIEHCVVLFPHDSEQQQATAPVPAAQLPAPLHADPSTRHLAFVRPVYSGRTDRGRRGRRGRLCACFRLVGMHGWGLGQPWNPGWPACRRSSCRLALLVSGLILRLAPTLRPRRPAGSGPPPNFGFLSTPSSRPRPSDILRIYVDLGSAGANNTSPRSPVPSGGPERRPCSARGTAEHAAGWCGPPGGKLIPEL